MRFSGLDWEGKSIRRRKKKNIKLMEFYLKGLRVNKLKEIILRGFYEF